jgi:hypothetical protein
MSGKRQKNQLELAFNEEPRGEAFTFAPAVIDALRIDAFDPDGALIALPDEPTSGVRTGLQMPTI